MKKMITTLLHSLFASGGQKQELMSVCEEVRITKLRTLSYDFHRHIAKSYDTVQTLNTTLKFENAPSDIRIDSYEAVRLKKYGLNTDNVAVIFTLEKSIKLKDLLQYKEFRIKNDKYGIDLKPYYVDTQSSIYRKHILNMEQYLHGNIALLVMYFSAEKFNRCSWDLPE